MLTSHWRYSKRIAPLLRKGKANVPREANVAPLRASLQKYRAYLEGAEKEGARGGRLVYTADLTEIDALLYVLDMAL